MLIHSRMDKYIKRVYSILQATLQERELIIMATSNNRFQSPKHNVKQKKADTKKYIL